MTPSETHLAAARAALTHRDPLGAVREAEAAAAAGAGGAEPHWLTALGLAASGRPGMALVAAGRGEGHAPDDPRAALVCAAVAALSGKSEAAEVFAAAALDRDPACAAAHAVRAGLCLVAEDWDGADAAAAAGLLADPDHPACERIAELAGDPIDRMDPNACGLVVWEALVPDARDLARVPAAAAAAEGWGGWFPTA
ncbi:hypothetical protein [Alienimonas californiensis]|uniref:Tetratricopeptide repeat protein n=1 Tax=Alienimonas californiensis TaxID=2527989 RepID=A0A517PAM6_9PLAN|nr:hypothetical protein [Alienimonas californiensis]QDT16425.1 hypothetical protein CA12_25270 [Alienimonas californiensis]